MTVFARTSDAFSIWHEKVMPAVDDDAGIGRAADRVRVTAYDEHVRVPGAVASIGWVEQVARGAAVRLQGNAVTASPYATWTSRGVRHVVEFSDARATRARRDLARRHGFAGIALWAPGQEDPATWAALRS